MTYALGNPAFRSISDGIQQKIKRNAIATAPPTSTPRNCVRSMSFSPESDCLPHR